MPVFGGKPNIKVLIDRTGSKETMIPDMDKSLMVKSEKSELKAEPEMSSEKRAQILTLKKMFFALKSEKYDQALEAFKDLQMMCEYCSEDDDMEEDNEEEDSSSIFR